MSDNPYETLGVPKTASKEQVRRAYKRRAAKAHPDRQGGNAALMAQLNSAYALLSDDSKREHYDRAGEAPPPEQSIEAEAAKMCANVFSQVMDDPQFEEADLISAVAQKLRLEHHNALSQMASIRRKMARDEKRVKRLKYKQTRTSHDFLTHVLEARVAGCKAGLKVGERFIEIVDKALQLLGDFSWERGEGDEVLGLQGASALFRALHGGI